MLRLIRSGTSAKGYLCLGLKHGKIKLLQPIGRRAYVLSSQLSIKVKSMVSHMPKLERKDRRMADMG